MPQDKNKKGKSRNISYILYRRCFFIDLKVNGKKIDKYQKKVIKTKNRNNLVIAGAGSGKTFTIIAKIKYLTKQIAPEEILCLTFTKEAAKNLEEKLKKENIIIKVKTFHSLGYEIIRKHKNIEIADEKDLDKIIDKHLKQYKRINYIINKKFIRLGYPDPIYEKLENNIILNSDEKTKITNTIKTFISLYKSNNYKIKDFKKFNEINNKTNISDEKKRHYYFLRLVKRIIINYEYFLKKRQKIDYNDMINLSTKIIKNKGIDNYKYIIIDEYQDTSLNKANLIKEIQNKTGAKLLAVGDDWQSIYSFTGSNLEIFTNFKKIFKKAKIIKLKKTYRNSKELLKITSKFICKNKKQIPKKLKSNKTNKTPIHIYYYKENINEIWDEVLNKVKNTNTIILGRNNIDKGKVPKLSQNMKYLTIHKSKGLESENTVIINLEDDYKSLPSKIKDSKYLMYVKPEIDKYKYAEERRLFYVALTRSRNNTYLLVKKSNPSIFIEELKQISNNIVINDNCK